jgi:glutamate 5-kinase
VCLSDIDGLYEQDPREDPEAKRIPLVPRVEAEILAMAGDRPGRAGRGGMRSKLEDARMATACGVPMIVAAGRAPEVLMRLFVGENLGTLFLPPEGRRLYGRKPWIALALVREGSLLLDAGAVNALVRHGKSLLPVGVRSVEGFFEAGACVVCKSPSGDEVAVGLTGYSSEELRMICGCQTGEICARIGYEGTAEVIHRDNMVIL